MRQALLGSGGVDLESGRALARLLEVVDDGGVVAVLGAVAGVRGGEVSLVVHLGETHVVCRAPGMDLPAAGGRGGAEPVRAAAVGGADEDPLAISDDPDGPWTAEGAVGTARGDLHLLRCGHRACFHRTGRKRLHHPVVGDLDLTYEALDLTSASGLTLLVYTAEPDTATQDSLNLLASWAATTLQEERGRAQSTPDASS